MINAEAVIQTLIANIGNPESLIAKAENVQVPHVSRRGMEAFRKRFALVGQAMAHRNILGFLQRLKSSMDQEKRQGEAERAQQQQSVATEGVGQPLVELNTDNINNYRVGMDVEFVVSDRSPQLRRGTIVEVGPESMGIMVPGSHRGIMHTVVARMSKVSQCDWRKGGSLTDAAFEARLNSRLATIEEDIAVRAQGASLAAEQGRLVVDGEIAVNNHADILKLLTMWLLENEPEVMRDAVDSMANMVRKGTVFRGE